MRYLMFVATDPDAEPYDPDDDHVEEWVAKHDGPFAESREWIAGFDILDCADLDEAIAVAA